MLTLCHQHLKPVNESLLFLVLPLACLTNSRYMSVASLQDLMSVIGFELVKERWKNGGKVGYWLWGWRQPVHSQTEGRRRWERKRVVQEGPKRNNFSILL
jgi:25S rRNA (adenine2142-N1)-methyltransferase